MVLQNYSDLLHDNIKIDEVVEAVTDNDVVKREDKVHALWYGICGTGGILRLQRKIRQLMPTSRTLGSNSHSCSQSKTSCRTNTAKQCCFEERKSE